MTEDANRRSPEEVQACRCPFCGADASEWNVCVHLLADFGDSSDGDRGILCEADGSRCGNAALNCLEPIYQALLAFAETISSKHHVTECMSDDARSQLIQTIVGSNEPPLWLSTVLDEVSAGEVTDEWTVKLLWEAAVPWSEHLVKREVILGSMASTAVTFIWGQDPVKGTRQIGDAMERLAAEIRTAQKRLAHQTPA